MFHSDSFQQQPRLYIFLPFYYALWEDSVLTPSEIQVMQKLFQEMDWLSTSESEILKGKINPQKAPSPEELKHWKKEIQKLDLEVQETLTDIGLALVDKFDSKANFSEKTIQSFRTAELELGIVGREARYIFKKGHLTVTTVQQAESNFAISEMTGILNGNRAELINKVKKIISDPTFSLREYENLKDQREQALQWCRALAEQGLGSWAYPEFAGGKDDMEGWSCTEIG
jgi:acyl-CoA oxidase